ncbi:hypothetical protein [Nonomuraea recticatena]|uniref:Uncharacterized protein n=1 Tax=Nonomuraea recticatena TaxID=46178 RepID=A0ABP6FSZ4_9ACTN
MTDTGNRRLGETVVDEQVPIDTDRKWWPIAPDRRPHLKAIVYVAAGTVVRVRAVDPDQSKWREDDRGYCDVPSARPSPTCRSPQQLPSLQLRPGNPRPHTRGKLREFLLL